MTAIRDDAACTGAVVRNPPMKELAPSAAQLRDTMISGHCYSSTARVSALRGASPVAAPSMAEWSYAFPRQIEPTGKSLPIFRNNVKPRNQKYPPFVVRQINGMTRRILSREEGRRPSSRTWDRERWTRMRL